MTKFYPKKKCWICGQHISTNGLGYTSHMKKHVREGILKNVYTNKWSKRSYPFTKFELLSIEIAKELYPDQHLT